MIKLATIDNPRLAQAFIDYLAYRGIELELQYEEDQKFGLWLLNMQHQVEAEAELMAFLRDPFAAKYQSASWSMAESRTAKFKYSSVNLWQKIKNNAGFVTLGVMGFCVVVYFALILGFDRDILALMLFPSQEGQRWQLWRLFSHALLHFSSLHILFNLLWWWVLGGKIELKLGSAKLLQLFLISALFSGFAQYLLSGPTFGGLSGVVYALLGYIWMLQKFAPSCGLEIEKGYIVMMLAWLVIGFTEPFGMAVANMAHLFGLLSGIVIGFIDSKRVLK